MRRLLRNWQLKLLAVFIATTTWSVVAYAGNPPNAQAFKGVAIERGQAPKGLVLVKEPVPVMITVRGLQSSLASFRRESLHASIDMSGARLGSHLLPVRVRVDSPDHSVAFASVEPSNVDVELDQLSTVQRKVDVRAIGAPNTCCVVGAGTATPDTVALSGPAKQLETAVAYVNVDVAARGTPVQGAQNVLLEGPGHAPLPQVSASPGQVSVVVPIAAVKQTKPAGINPVATGQPATGFQITDVQVIPVVCEIEADPGVLAGIHSIDTEPISIAGATSDIVANVNFRPPTGVTLLTKGTVTVHFVIKANPVVRVTPSPAITP